MQLLNNREFIYYIQSRYLSEWISENVYLVYNEVQTRIIPKMI